mmetsp:Transcript_42820/g.63525  ORF Transcript_42820/g.63525 Transcript_42820/m.63525 type:complete len:220 (-) Transcript_42820:657-1316(-)
MTFTATTRRSSDLAAGWSSQVAQIRWCLWLLRKEPRFIVTTLSVVVRTAQKFCLVTAVVARFVVGCVRMILIAGTRSYLDGTRRRTSQQHRSAITHMSRVQEGIMGAIGMTTTASRSVNECRLLLHGMRRLVGRVSSSTTIFHTRSIVVILRFRDFGFDCCRIAVILEQDGRGRRDCTDRRCRLLLVVQHAPSSSVLVFLLVMRAVQTHHARNVANRRR